MRTRKVLGDKVQLSLLCSHFCKGREIQIVKCLAYRGSINCENNPDKLSSLELCFAETKRLEK